MTNISTHITRLAKIFAPALAAAAFAVPAASANNGLVDDWFRDANVVATAPVTDRLVDDYFRDGARATTPDTDRIVDDSFRDANVVATAPVTDRLVDDYFRDASTVTAPQTSSNTFAWGEFGIGAGAMLGLVLLTAGLGLGALAVRHRGDQLRTS
jgi:hypothetical protein